jgi:anti-sigma regulatory factor (Ser/Thr protein kinase)
MTWSVSLRVRNDLNELTRLAHWLNTCAEQHSIPEQTAQHVDLCIAEAVTNIMTHGFADEGTHEIALSLEQQGKDVVLQIEDDGVAFDPTAAEPPPLATLDSTRIGGWGMRIVRRFSDEVRYRRIDGRNCLTLVFHQHSPAGT